MDSPQQCPKCGNEHPATTDFFYPKRKGSLELRATCKECISKQGKEYVASHKEQHQASMQANYLAHKDEYQERDKKQKIHNPGGQSKRSRTYRKRHHVRLLTQQRAERYAHPERNRQWSRDYRKRHPGRAAIITRRWRVNHRDRANVCKRNYYARKRQAQGSHTAQDVQKQYERQKGKCYYCKRKLATYHVDHVIPLSRGGSNGPENLVIACPSCNSSKHNKLLHEWPKGGRLL